MDGREHAAAVFERHDLAANPADGCGSAGHAAHRRRAERDDQRRLDELPFERKPQMAAFDLVSVGPLVHAALAAWLEFEMLDGICHEDLVTIDAGRVERLREKPASRSDEGMPLPILLIARLLADHHHACPRRPLTRHDLRGVAMEGAALARSFPRAQRL